MVSVVILLIAAILIIRVLSQQKQNNITPSWNTQCLAPKKARNTSCLSWLHYPLLVGIGYLLLSATSILILGTRYFQVELALPSLTCSSVYSLIFFP